MAKVTPNRKMWDDRCGARFHGEQCRLMSDHEYRGLSHRFIGPVEPPVPMNPDDIEEET